MSFSSLVVPFLLVLVGIFALFRRIDVYAALTKGAEEGFAVLLRILPTLVPLFAAIYMFRASGAMEFLSSALSPILTAVGIPPEAAPLVLIRPVSGSGALAIGRELMRNFGVDSEIGRIVAVMLGSSETTFYTIAVYSGSVGVTDMRYTAVSALIADAVMFLTSAWAVRFFMQQ